MCHSKRHRHHRTRAVRAPDRADRSDLRAAERGRSDLRMAEPGRPDYRVAGPSRPDLRVADADRDRTAAQLREHAGAGRLSVDELEARLERAYDATTHADIAPLTADLPHVRLPEDARAHRQAEWRGFVSHATTYLAVIAGLVLIWVLTGADSHFWPIWPALGWGIGVASHGSGVLRPGRPRHRHALPG